MEEEEEEEDLVIDQDQGVMEEPMVDPGPIMIGGHQKRLLNSVLCRVVVLASMVYPIPITTHTRVEE